MSKFDPDDPELQGVRRETLLNDARVREQSRNGDTGTFLSHTHIDDAGGRFAAVNAAKVVGQTPGIAAAYPAASAAHQTQLPNEEPLGYRIDAMGDEPSTVLPAVEATGGSANAPSSPACLDVSQLDVERAESPSLQTDQDENQ